MRRVGLVRVCVLTGIASMAFLVTLACGTPCSAGSAVTVSGTESWPATTYYLDSLTITSTGHLTLQAGCVLKFDSSAGGVIVEGTLVASGASLNPVVFTSSSGTPSSWDGIVVESGGVLDLDYAEVDDAGYGVNIVYVDGGQASLDHCLITDGDWAGVEVSGSTSDLTLDDVVVRDCWEGVDCYDGGNVTISDLSVSDVDFNGIAIWDCGDVSITDSTVTSCGNCGMYAWSLSSLSMDGCAVSDCGHGGAFAWDIPEIQMSGCTLESCSTSGSYPALWVWDANLDLEDCSLSQAGLALEYGQSDETTRRSLEVNGTHFSSGGYALVSGDLNFDLSGSRNAIPVTYLEGTLRDDTTLPSGQCFGTTYGLLGQALYSMQESEYGALGRAPRYPSSMRELRRALLAQAKDNVQGLKREFLGQALRNVREPEHDVLSRALYDTEEPEHFTIDSGATLSVQGGTTFLAKSGEPYAAIQVAGALETLGTSNSSRVVFTSEDATPGSWAGIWVESGGNLSLEYAEVSYGGYSCQVDNVSRQDNIQANGGEATLTNCLVSDSAGDGIHVADGDLIMTWSRIADNQCGVRVLGGEASLSYCQVWTNSLGLYVDLPGTQPSVHNSSFVGNAGYAVYNNRSNTTVSATSNWWGRSQGCPLENPNSAWNLGETVDVGSYLDEDPTPETLPPPPPVHQWYSQRDPQATGGEWDDTHLEVLFFPESDKAGIPFDLYPADEEHPYGGIVQRWGCVATSWAMVLGNLDVKTVNTRTDFRSEVTDNLDPDPLTVTFANIGDWTVYPDTQGEETIYNSLWDGHNPVEMNNYAGVIGEFDVTARYYRFVRTKLSEAVEEDDESMTFEDDSVVSGDGCYVTIEDEIVKIVGPDANPGAYLVGRGQAGTDAAAHDAGAWVYEGTEDLRAWMIHNLLTEDCDPETPGVQCRTQGIVGYFEYVDDESVLHSHGLVFVGSELGPTDFPNPSDLYSEVDGRWVDLEAATAEEEVLAEDIPASPRGPETMEAAGFRQGLRVCDPRAETAAEGADVLLSQSGASSCEYLIRLKSIWVVETP